MWPIMSNKDDMEIATVVSGLSRQRQNENISFLNFLNIRDWFSEIELDQILI